MPIRVLLAEDTRDLNRALTTVLELEGYEVTATFDGEEALDMLSREIFDAVLLDIMMPKKDGLSVLSHMRKTGIFTPVLLLTAKSEIDDRVAGLDAGADDYLVKPFAMKELLARVRSMTRRGGDYGAQRLEFEDLVLDGQNLELSSANAVRLSAKEFGLMRALVMNSDRELSGTYLLGRVWGGEADVSTDTVELYVEYLRGKLRWVGSNARIAEGDDGYRLLLDTADDQAEDGRARGKR